MTASPPLASVSRITPTFLSKRCRKGAALLLALSLTGSVVCGAAPTKLQIDDQDLPREKHPQLSYRDVVDRVAPSVVTIYSSRTVRTNQQSPLFSDPLFRQFFGGRPGQAVPPEQQQRSLGSGVIVSKDGYIITNSHVIDDADSIRVALPDRQGELDARVIGSDPQTDIAVVKIDRTGLTAATLADSDKLVVGDVVLALGNPFNVGQTVTMGIAGAIGRGGMGIEAYEDFIQTDASINPGNSGGPLVDGLGRVVGINTAILSRTGGNQGVGFAVPINLARHVFEQIAAHGSVTRGYLGVVVQPITEDLAREFDLEGRTGALVADVAPSQPAARAGLQSGDVIVSFNNQTVDDARNLQLLVAQESPGTKVPLKIQRAGQEQTIEVTLGEQPNQGLAGRGQSGGALAPDPSNLFAGLDIQDLDPGLRRQAGIPEGINGAIITAVEPGSPAAEAGLQPGDVILGIDHQSVQNAADAANLSRHVSRDRVLLRVWSRGGTAFVVMSRPEQEEE